jgi:hypothetical protein
VAHAASLRHRKEHSRGSQGRCTARGQERGVRHTVNERRKGNAQKMWQDTPRRVVNAESLRCKGSKATATPW